MKRSILLALSGLLMGCQTQLEPGSVEEQDQFEYMQILVETDSIKRIRIYGFSFDALEEKELCIPLKGYTFDYIKGGDKFNFSCEPGDCPTYSISEKIKYNLIKQYGDTDESMFDYLSYEAYPRFIKENVDADGFQYCLDWSYLKEGSNTSVSFGFVPGYSAEPEYYSIELRSKNFVKKCRFDIYYEDLETSKTLKKGDFREYNRIDSEGHYSVEFYVPNDIFCNLFTYDTYENYESFYNQYDAIIFEQK